MDVKDAIAQRRAYRSLDKVEITEDLVKDLAKHAQLAPSCFNYQPWRYVFVFEEDMLTKLHDALSKGNEWAHDASMIIAVFSRKDLDCVIKERIYYLFDTGMATALLILRATELGLVAHPIAGFSEKKVKDILGIPEDMRLITLVIVGKHSNDIKSVLSKDQAKAEKIRPDRLPFEKYVHLNRYSGDGEGG